MTVISEDPASNLISKTMKAIAARPLSIGAILTGLGSIVTFSVLFTYLSAIGHPELLSPALGAPTALLPWIIIAALLLAMYLGGLMIASAFYATALAFFNHKPKVQPYMATMLMLPATAGITAMVTSIIIGPHKGALLALTVSAATVITLMLFMFLIPKFRTAVQQAAQPENSATPNTKARRIANICGLIAAIWGTALSATFPMLILINTYPWPADRYELYKLAGICVIITVLGLLPAAAFFIFKGGMWMRTRYTLGGVVLVVAGALYFAPATIPKVVDNAAKIIGIKSLEVSSYMIKDTYAAEDFDSRWGEVSTLRDDPVIEAFPLFSLGDQIGRAHV